LLLTFSSQSDFQLSTDWISPSCLLYNHFARTEMKRHLQQQLFLYASLPIRCLETGSITPLFYCCMRVYCGRYLAAIAIQSHRLTTSLYATTLLRIAWSCETQTTRHTVQDLSLVFGMFLFSLSSFDFSKNRGKGAWPPPPQRNLYQSQA
jgi:hypothetical protein